MPSHPGPGHPPGLPFQRPDSKPYSGAVTTSALPHPLRLHWDLWAAFLSTPVPSPGLHLSPQPPALIIPPSSRCCCLIGVSLKKITAQWVMVTTYHGFQCQPGPPHLLSGPCHMAWPSPPPPHLGTPGWEKVTSSAASSGPPGLGGNILGFPPAPPVPCHATSFCPLVLRQGLLHGAQLLPPVSLDLILSPLP